MIKLFILAALAVATSAFAQVQPFWKTLGPAGGNPTTTAEVDFLSVPNLSFRLVNVYYKSDTNNGALSISTGLGAYAIAATNAATTTATNVFNTTAGLPASATLLLEHAGLAYVQTLSSTNSGTNVVLSSGGWGVLPTIGDSVYVMSTPVTLPVGAATNAINGDAIFIGNYGRPVRVQLTTPLATNNILAASGKYE